MPIINRKACAGTLESSDVYVELEPSVSGIELNLESAVIEQFGEAISALDCVIRARVETALRRGMEERDA